MICCLILYDPWHAKIASSEYLSWSEVKRQEFRQSKYEYIAVIPLKKICRPSYENG